MITKEELLRRRDICYQELKVTKARLKAITKELNALSPVSKDDGESMLEYLIDRSYECQYEDSKHLAMYSAQEEYEDTTYDEALNEMIEIEEQDRPEVQRALADRLAREVLLGDKQLYIKVVPEGEHLGLISTGKHSIYDFEVFLVKKELLFMCHEDPDDLLSYSDMKSFFNDKEDDLDSQLKKLGLVIPP